jgi:hypothetical protein
MSFRWQSFVSIASVWGIKKRAVMRLENSVANIVKQEQEPEARVYSMIRLSNDMIVKHTECVTWTVVWTWIVIRGVNGRGRKRRSGY